MQHNLPNLLIIGAMKAGSTTLHRDLSGHPDIYFPENKEPENLCDDEVLSESGLIRYMSLFKNNVNTKYRGDASTAYAKMPTKAGVPERAKKLLGTDIKIIYLVRDPVNRMISHHYHEYSLGSMGPNFLEELNNNHVLVDYSRYAYQVSFWTDYFSKNNILVIQFEDYIKSKKDTISKIYKFLDVEDLSQNVDEELALNVGDSKLVAKSSLSTKILASDFYQYKLKTMIPWKLRLTISKLLLSSPPTRPLVIKSSIPNSILNQLETEQRLINELK